MAMQTSAPKMDVRERSARPKRAAAILLAPFAAVTALVLGVGRQRNVDYAQETMPARPTRGVARVLSNFAMQDWLVILYLLFLLASVLAGEGPRRAKAIGYLAADLAVCVTCISVERGCFVRLRGATARFASRFLYRAALVGALVSTFLQLHYILPSARDVRYDALIYAFDLRVFRFEPAILLDRFVTPHTTEWFAFFYYSYFFILLLYTVPIAFFEKRTAIASEFSLGILWVMAIGQAVYVLVPGQGPYGLLSAHFTNRLEGRFWWPLVWSTVDSFDGTLRTDIFPSLHTAAPTFLALFAARHRAHRPYRWAWPVTAFFASQIVIATMFLGWHYLADVVAGLVLAVTGLLVARRFAAAEQRSRSAFGCTPVWEPLLDRPREVARRTV